MSRLDSFGRQCRSRISGAAFHSGKGHFRIFRAVIQDLLQGLSGYRSCREQQKEPKLLTIEQGLGRKLILVELD